MKVYRKVSNFSGKSKISTWLYRIAVNVCIDHTRRGKSRRSKSLSVDENSLTNYIDDSVKTDRSVIQSEVNRLTKKAISQLSPKLRTVVVLRDLQGMAHSEIADILGCYL